MVLVESSSPRVGGAHDAHDAHHPSHINQHHAHHHHRPQHQHDEHYPQHHHQHHHQQHHPHHQYHPEANASNSNSNSNSSADVMERVLFQLHLRSCHFGLRYLSARTRRFLEHLLLVVAIAGFGALILLHRNFVFRNNTNNNNNNNTHHHHHHGDNIVGIGSSIGSSSSIGSNSNCATTCFSSIPNFDPTADLYRLSILPITTNVTRSYLSGSYLYGTKQPQQPQPQHLEDTCQGDQDGAEEPYESIGGAPPPPPPPPISYSYSLTKAYLMLPSNHSLLQHIPHIQHIVVSPHDPHCFGEPFLQFLIHNMIGYETIACNWWVYLLYLQQQQQQQHTISSSSSSSTIELVGHVYSPWTGQLQELRLPISALDSKQPVEGDASVHQSSSQQDSQPPPPQDDISSWLWWASLGRGRSSSSSSSSSFKSLLSKSTILSKLIVLIKTTFLFFFSTTLISFTLRETQERMLEFTQELSRRVSVQLPLVDLVVFHLIHNVVFVPIMVGMMFFLIEFYSGDKLLAFLVMTIVWCVEVFSVISLRSDQGITFFPRMFFLLFCLFHIYYFANPYGFAYTALVVVGCFMWHSMAFFWHRYELPAVALGRVTIDRPRWLLVHPDYHNHNHHHHPDHHHHHHPSDNNNNNDNTGVSPTTAAAGTSSPSSSPTHIRGFSLLRGPPSPPQIRSVASTTSTTQPLSSSLPMMPRATDDVGATSSSSISAPTLEFARPQTASFSGNNYSSSQNSSIFRSGDNDNDDDDDDDDDDHGDDGIHGGDGDSSSYVYFMQGEVVVHRGPRNNNNNNNNNSSNSGAAFLTTVESSHTLASTTSGQDQQQPQLAVLEESSSSAVGLDTDGMYAERQERPDTIVYSSPDRRDVLLEDKQQHQQQQDMYSGEDSKSGLQAILEVRLTPRHRNGGGGGGGGSMAEIGTGANHHAGSSTVSGGFLEDNRNNSHQASSSSSSPLSSDQYVRVAHRSSAPTFPDLPS